MSVWPRKFKTYWCVIDGRGTAYLSTARTTKSKSIAAWVQEVAYSSGEVTPWASWRRAKYKCRKVDIKVRDNPAPPVHANQGAGR